MKLLMLNAVVGLISCGSKPEQNARTPIETLTAFYAAVNAGDSVKANQLSSWERKGTMQFVWPLFEQELVKGIQYRIEAPEIVEYSPDSLACEIYYDRIEYDVKRDTVSAVRRDYSVTAVKDDGEWLLHSVSDNPFAGMLEGRPEALEFFRRLKDTSASE